MFALEPARTPYDLNWRMFGISVRVHPLFWLIAALLGASSLNEGISFLLVWVGCVFISILIHELGHVLAGRMFGARGHIVLYSFGGLAIGSSNLRSRWQRVIVYFAGPVAGFLFLGFMLGAVHLALAEGLPPMTGQSWMRALIFRMRSADWSPLLLSAFFDLMQINLFWGILNLLPIWPLDGGRISLETLEWLLPNRGTKAALAISGSLAGLLAINSVAGHFGRDLLPFLPRFGLYSAFLFGMLALSSFQLYQAVAAPRRESWEPEELTPWEREHEDRDQERDYWQR